MSAYSHERKSGCAKNGCDIAHGEGFVFLGYHFGLDGLSVAKKTVENFVARAIRLYEQEPGEACASSRLGLYVRRWVRWVQAGLPEGRPPP